MNKGRQNQAHSKKAVKRKPEPQINTKKKESTKETAMESEGSPQQLSHKFQKPIELIDEAFMTLDKISKILNDSGGKGVSNDALDEFQEMLDRVKDQLSLEQLHNLQYSNRLSYIIDVASRKCPKAKNVPSVTKMAEAQIQRVQLLYEQYFSDFGFLQEMKEKYAGMMAE